MTDHCLICGQQGHWARFHRTGQTGTGFKDGHDGPQWLYVIADRLKAQVPLDKAAVGHWKVGRSLSPFSRLRRLQKSSGKQYQLVGTGWVLDGSAAERRVHQYLRDAHKPRWGQSGGNEWFQCSLGTILRAFSAARISLDMRVRLTDSVRLTDCNWIQQIFKSGTLNDSPDYN